MVKNSSGGNKAKNKARKNYQTSSPRYENLKPTEDQCYALITSVYGGGRYQVKFKDDTKRIGVCCGKLKRGRRPKMGDLVCISLRDFQEDKCDILYLYSPEDLSVLMKHDVDVQIFCNSVDTSFYSQDVAIEFGEEKEENEEDFWDKL
jgi:translation initiation factor 1A